VAHPLWPGGSSDVTTTKLPNTAPVAGPGLAREPGRARERRAVPRPDRGRLHARLADLIERIADEVPGGEEITRPYGGDFEAAQISLIEAANALLETAVDSGSPETARACSLLFELGELRQLLFVDRVDAGYQALRNVARALSHLGAARSAAALMDRATQELAASGAFERAVMFTLEHGCATPRSAASSSDAAWGSAVLARLQAQPWRLADMEIEAEVVRRATPALVRVATCKHAHEPFVAALGCRSYAVAAVRSDLKVLGFIVADHGDGPREVDALDRETLGAFAEGVGFALERAFLIDRMRDQRHMIRQLLTSTDDSVSFAADDADGNGDPTASAQQRLAAIDLMAQLRSAQGGLDEPLTPRELEVLALMSEGATNSTIAERLVISEGTVKSHVKHILRKLGVANRAAAVLRFARSAEIERDSR
jgi:LuxR family transcriptional regulator, regulator of acetate metabolism